MYNHEKYIAESINSVLNQSYKDFEIIIVNDCSTDNSLNIVRKFKDPRIKIINLAKNKGIGNARNEGVNVSVGEYITFLSSDDYWKEDFLSRTVKMLEQMKVGIVFTGYERIIESDNTSNIQKFDDLPKSDYIFKLGEFYHLVNRYATNNNMFVNYSAIIGKSEYFKGDYSFWGELRYGEDLYHLLKVRLVTQFGYINTPLACYRQHSSNTTGMKINKIQNNNDKIIEKINRERKENNKRIINVGLNTKPQIMENISYIFNNYSHLFEKDHDFTEIVLTSNHIINITTLQNEYDIIILNIDIDNLELIRSVINDIPCNKKIYMTVSTKNDKIDKNVQLIRQLSDKFNKNIYSDNINICNEYKSINFVPHEDITDLNNMLFKNGIMVNDMIKYNNKNKVNILQVSYSDCAGIMSKWKELFDSNSTKFNVRQLTQVKHGYNYPIDLLPDSPGLIEIIKKTDIFIFHPFILKGEFTDGLINDGVDSKLCNIDWRKYTKGKRVYCFLNGSINLRHFSDQYKQLIPSKYEKVFCSTPDLANMFKFAEYIPVPLDINSPLYSLENNQRNTEMIKIYHFPTNRPIKNTEEFNYAMQYLSKLYNNIEYKVIDNMSNNNVIELKKKIHFCFDHMQGYYGVNSLEAASVGAIPLVHLTEENKMLLQKFTNDTKIPFIDVKSCSDIISTIEHYLKNKHEIKIKSDQCVNWMKKHWNQRKFVKYIESILFSKETAKQKFDLIEKEDQVNNIICNIQPIIQGQQLDEQQLNRLILNIKKFNKEDVSQLPIMDNTESTNKPINKKDHILIIDKTNTIISLLAEYIFKQKGYNAKSVGIEDGHKIPKEVITYLKFMGIDTRVISTTHITNIDIDKFDKIIIINDDIKNIVNKHDIIWSFPEIENITVNQLNVIVNEIRHKIDEELI